MVDCREELSHVCLEGKTRLGIVLTHCPDESIESRKRAVRPFANAAGVRVKNERPIKERIEDAIECVMDNPVADGRFVDLSRFWVGDREQSVRAVTIGLIEKRGAQPKEVAFEVSFETLHVWPRSFAATEFAPAGVKIFN